MHSPLPLVDYEWIDRAINRSIGADISQSDLRRHAFPIPLTLTLFVDIIKRGVCSWCFVLSSQWQLLLHCLFYCTFASSSLHSFCWQWVCSRRDLSVAVDWQVVGESVRVLRQVHQHRTWTNTWAHSRQRLRNVLLKSIWTFPK